MYALVLKSTPTAVAGVVMNRQSRTDNESDLTSLDQSEQYKSPDGKCEAGDVGKKPNKESHLSNILEKVHKNLFDESKSKKRSFFKTVARSIVFGLIVLIALTPPISTLAAIVYGWNNGFSWMLIFVPMLMWILTGLLTARLMVYKTDIKFKR